MIFYFSGTGNSKWIAKEIAEKTGDIAESIVDMNRNGRVPYKAETGETLGFVFPVYAWGPPLIFMEFASKVIFDESNYLFGACTCGGSAGNAMEILSKIVPLSSAFHSLCQTATSSAPTWIRQRRLHKRSKKQEKNFPR